MATRVLSMSARLGPVPQPPAPQDEPVFAQLKPVLGAANPARDAALFPGEELKHAHHRSQPVAQPALEAIAGRVWKIRVRKAKVVLERLFFLKKKKKKKKKDRGVVFFVCA
uniref:Uncharacterized protein n=1 Tax=Rhinopithecus bieti TaxID=61621 RepID=A0A2K6KIN8_RHIBE